MLSTIALAWLCAMFMNPDAATADFTHSPRTDGGDDVVVIQRAFGHTRINRAQCAELRLDPDTGSILLARWASTGNESSATHAGWPFRALSCRNTAQISIVAGNSAMQVQRAPAKAVEGGWELPAFERGRLGGLGGTWRAIPLRPIWSGLFADIAVLGALWFAIIFGFGAWRRRRRRERGRCAWCGYDLRSGGVTHDRCPECGAMV